MCRLPALPGRDSAPACCDPTPPPPVPSQPGKGKNPALKTPQIYISGRSAPAPPAHSGRYANNREATGKENLTTARRAREAKIKLKNGAFSLPVPPQPLRQRRSPPARGGSAGGGGSRAPRPYLARLPRGSAGVLAAAASASTMLCPAAGCPRRGLPPPGPGLPPHHGPGGSAPPPRSAGPRSRRGVRT